MKTSFKKILTGALFASLFINFNANAQWSLTGNAATAPGTVTAPGTNFLGTTDAQDLVLRTNNLERLRITSAGNFSLGSIFANGANPVLTVQNRRGTDYYQTGVVASFIQHSPTSTPASPLPLNKVNILDAFPARGSGYINGSSYQAGVWKTYFSVGLYGTTVIGDHSVMLPPLTNYSGFNLAVQGGILTEKVKIALITDATNWSWPDYVFKKDYNLLSLKEVESYINKNKHLPGVPSEAEVKTNGLDVAEMEASLLKKIEELTLYMIDVQKQLDLLKEENKKLKEEKK